MNATPTTREDCQQRILALRKAVNTYLAYGNVEDAERVRDQISGLERELDHINKQQRQGA